MTKVKAMPSNTESQCYFIQLQIDGYLDGDLSEAQRGVFMSHVQDCSGCASEFRYAQTIQDAVLELPQMSCADSVLEPIHRLSAAEMQPAVGVRSEPLSSQIWALFNSVPAYFRYGFPAAAVAVVAMVIGTNITSPVGSVEPLVASESVEQYSPEDISQALDELNVAIDYLNRLSQRTEVMIGDRFLVSPIQDSINASFQKAGIRENSPLNNGPI